MQLRYPAAQKIYIVVDAKEQYRQQLQKVIDDNIDNTYIPLIDINSLGYPSFWLKPIVQRLVSNIKIDNNQKTDNSDLKLINNVLYLNFLPLTTSFNYEYFYINYLDNIINTIKFLYTINAMVMTNEEAEKWQCVLIDGYTDLYKLQSSKPFGFIFDRLQQRDHLIFVGYNKVVKHDIAVFYKTINVQKQPNLVDNIPVYYLGYVSLKIDSWLDYDNIDKISNIKFNARGQVQTSFDLIDNAITYYDLDDNKKQLIYSIKI